MTDAEG